jgi:hypothetical protein
MKKKHQKKHLKTRPKTKAKPTPKEKLLQGNLIGLVDRLYDIKTNTEAKSLSSSNREQTLHYAKLLKRQLDDLHPFASPAVNQLRNLTNEIIARNEDKTLIFQGKTYVVQSVEETGYPSSGFKRVKIEAICREPSPNMIKAPF